MSTTHSADARALLDERGYSGALIRGQNPALLFEKAVRDRITESYYWKEQCFGLNAATLCDRAVELNAVGGTYGGMGKPTPFLCLAFKMLQLVPERGVVLAYLNWPGGEGEEEEGEQDDTDAKTATPDGTHNTTSTNEFKYLRALAAFYIRLAWEPVDIYKTLEPLLADGRKLKRRTKDGFRLTYVDDFVDDLLTKDRVCATSLWKLPPRTLLEDLELLDPRVSPLGDEVDELDEEGDGEGDVEREEGAYSSGVEVERRSRSRESDRSASRSVSRSRSRSRSRERRSYSRERRSRSYSREDGDVRKKQD
ncbi:PRP38 family-domain-containing protein [Phyllosticta capitalensis]